MSEVVARAGGDTLGVLSGATTRGESVARVVGWRADRAIRAGDLILVVGSPTTPPRIIEMMEHAAAIGAAGVALRSGPATTHLDNAAHDLGLPALHVRPSLRWDEVCRRLRGVLPPSTSRIEQPYAHDVVLGESLGGRFGHLLGFRPAEPWDPTSVEVFALADEIERLLGADKAQTAVVGGRLFAVVVTTAPVVVARELVRFAATHLGIDLFGAVDRSEALPVRLVNRRAEINGALDVLVEEGRAVGSLDALSPRIVLSTLRAMLQRTPQLLSGRLERLQELDRQRRTDYCVTLMAYFDAAGDLNEAAAALFVHPNTVRYRMRRIQDLCGIDLNDPIERLVLELQLRLDRG